MEGLGFLGKEFGFYTLQEIFIKVLVVTSGSWRLAITYLQQPGSNLPWVTIKTRCATERVSDVSEKNWDYCLAICELLKASEKGHTGSDLHVHFTNEEKSSERLSDFSPGSTSSDVWSWLHLCWFYLTKRLQRRLKEGMHGFVSQMESDTLRAKWVHRMERSWEEIILKMSLKTIKQESGMYSQISY